MLDLYKSASMIKSFLARFGLEFCHKLLTELRQYYISISNCVVAKRVFPGGTKRFTGFFFFFFLSYEIENRERESMMKVLGTETLLNESLAR